MYEFDRGSNATVAANNICETYGQVISVRQSQEWFSRFRSGDRSLGDYPRPDLPILVENDVLLQMVKNLADR